MHNSREGNTKHVANLKVGLEREHFRRGDRDLWLAHEAER